MNKKKFIREKISKPEIKRFIKEMRAKGLSDKEIDHMVYLLTKDLDMIEDKMIKSIK